LRQISIIPIIRELSPNTPNRQAQKLILLQLKINLGYANGNNNGIHYALSNRNCDFVWLLNNDTVVHPEALSRLVQRMEARPDAGLCGSTLLFQHNPTMVQAFGGCTYNRWLSTLRHIGAGTQLQDLPEAEAIESQLDYLVAASMLVRRSFLERIGLLNEQYFLFLEEIDWATRAKGLFTLAYAPESLVFHKEGSSTKHSDEKKLWNWYPSYCFHRNRLLFTRLYYKKLTFFVLLHLSAGMIRRIFSGRWRELSAMWHGTLAGLKLPTLLKYDRHFVVENPDHKFPRR
jgi:GT2 family glycosyltransferase